MEEIMKRRWITERTGRTERTEPGSLTVEASFVAVASILVLFVVITLTLWLRDRTAVTAILWEGVEMTRQDEEAEVLSWLAEELDVQYYSEGSLTEFAVGEEEVAISYSGAQSVLGSWGSVRFTEEVSREIPDPVSFLYQCRLAEGIMEVITD